MSEKRAEELRVLLVEDDEGDRLLVRKSLGSSPEHPWVLTEVGALAEAQERLRIERFHVVLLDLSLPDSLGVSTLHAALEVARDTPVVVLTGDGDPVLGREVIQSGAQDWLPKSALSPGVLERALLHTIERQLRVGLERQLFHADRLASIGTIASGLVHELNNPTMTAQLNLQELQKVLDGLELPAREGNTARRMIADALGGIQAIRAIVQRLGSFSDLDLGAPEWVDLNAVVEEACALTQNLVRHRAVLEEDLHPLPRIPAHRSRLSQVVVNLLTNAAHAIPAGRSAEARVSVRTAQVAHGLQLIIEDTGPGIPPEAVDRIFDPFFSAWPQGRGLGLGLTISSEVIRQHGGYVDAYNRPGGGARFEVFLPFDTGIQAAERAPLPAPSSEDGERLRVLIVDDDERLLRILVQVLEEEYEVVAAAGGAAALALLEEDTAFDVVLCDLMMPEVDGAAVYQGLPEALRRRFVAMTGGVFTQRMRSFVEGLDNIVLEKPFDPKFLARLLNHLGTLQREG